MKIKCVKFAHLVSTLLSLPYHSHKREFTMTNLTVYAIDQVVRHFDHTNDQHVEIIREAMDLHYVRRLSITQVQWTEAGLEKAKAELPDGRPTADDFKIAVGKKVTRVNSGHDNGHKGEVVEINAENTRARVRWNHSGIRTWIRFSCLQVNA